jgi:hypothetical protein
MRVTPPPAMAASMAASALVTESQECNRIDRSRLPILKVQADGDAMFSNVMQSYRLRSLGFFGIPLAEKIGWAAADDPARNADARGDQAAVRQMSDPNGNIDVVVQVIEDTVRKDQANIDFRESLAELDDDRDDVESPERNRCRDGQLAPWCRVFPGRCALDLFDLIKNAFAGLHEVPAGLRQVQFSGRPVDESNFEM